MRVTDMAGRTFTLDTCVIRRICDGEHRFTALLKIRNKMTGSEILLNPTIVGELKRQGIDRAAVRRKLEETLEASVGFVETPGSMYAKSMKNRYPTIHHGDDMILACVMESRSVLVTCDRKLVLAAQQAGVTVINPDGARKGAPQSHQRQRRRRGGGWMFQIRHWVSRQQRWQAAAKAGT